MPRYEARIDLVGSSADAEKALGTLADAAEDTADRLEDSLSNASDKAGASLSGLVDDGSTSLSGIGDAAETNAGRLTDSFADSSGKVSVGLDDLAGTAAEKSGLIAGSLSDGFGDAAGASEVMVGKVTESLDALVATTTERATLISTRLDEAFAKSALAAQKLSGGSAATSGAEDAALAGGDLGLAKAGEKAEAEAGGIKDKIASAFKGVGSSLSNFGLLGAEQFTKMGESIEGAKTKAGSLKATLSSVGQLTTEVGLAAVIGFGAESVHLSDLYDTALASLKTAVKNSGASWDEYLPHLKAAQSESAKLGFNQTDVAQTLQALTTATNKPAEALKYLGEAENLARLKAEPLSDATSTLVKTLGGSARAVTQLGLNLDIGSGKLHSIQAATETVTKAQMSLVDAEKAASQTGVVGSQNQVQAMLGEQKAALSLSQAHLSGSNAVANALEGQKAAQAEVESGAIRGASAVALLQKSQMALTQSIETGGLRNQSAALSYMKALDSTKDTAEKDSYAQVAALEKVQTAQENLNIAKLNKSEDVNAISDALGALGGRTKGAATAYAETLPGQLKILDAEIHNVGISFGEFLTPKLEEAAKYLGDTLGWFEKNKTAAEALGIAVGVGLAGAVGTFGAVKLNKFRKEVQGLYSDLHKFGQKTFGGGASSAAPDEQVSTVGSASEASSGQVTGLGSAAEASAGQVTGLGAASEVSAGQISGLGASSEKMAGTVSASATEAEVSLGAIGTAAEATADAETVAGAEGGEGIAAMLGPIGLVAFAALEIATHWKLVKEVAEDVWHFLDKEVVHPMEAGFHWLEGEIGSHLGDIEHDAKTFGPALLVMLGPIGAIAGGAIELVEHWKTVSHTFDEVEGDLKRGWTRVEGDAKHLWNTVESDTDKGVHDVVGFVEKLPGDVLKVFNGANLWLVHKGEQLLEGLLQGAEHGAADIGKDLEKIGDKVLHDLSHPWSILSPSKATAEKGRFLIQGVPVGMKQELPALLSEVDHIGEQVLARFKLDGRDAGHGFMVDFTRGLDDGAHLAQSAVGNMFKQAEASALHALFAGGMNFGTTASGHPVGPGSSSVTQYNMPNAVIQANDPNQLARQLDTKTRRKNMVKT